MKKKIKKIKKAAKRPKKVKRLTRAKKTKIVKKAFLNVEKIKSDLKIVFENISELKKYLIENTSQIFNFGKMTPQQVRVSVFSTLIVFASLMAVIERYEYLKLMEDVPKPKTVQELKREYLENKIMAVVKGSPMEEMVPYIAEKDTKTAAFLVGIAKKESNWGERKPVLDGEDCFNYWGFRQERERMGSGGHTCFDSPKDAVDTVAARVSQIIERNSAESAKKMVVWKCGSSCATHSDESVDKWISDVDMYAEKILN